MQIKEERLEDDLWSQELGGHIHSQRAHKQCLGGTTAHRLRRGGIPR